MTAKNRRHVAVHVDRESSYWALLVPSDVDTCEEQATEMTARCKQLFETFEDFITPTAVEFYVHCFPRGQKLPVSVNGEDLLESIHRQVRDEEGIGLQAVQKATRVQGQRSRWIPRMGFDGTKVKVDLEQGPVLADRRRRTVEYRSKRPTEADPTRDVLELVLLHGPNNRHPEIESDYVTRVLVHTLSDIWFEDSALGRANARRLKEFLERIEDTLAVETVERTSDWLPVEDLEAIF